MIQLVLLTLLPSLALAAPSAKDWVERSEANTRGDSLQAEVTMAVESSGNTRNLEFRIWSVGRDKAVIKILKPVKDRDTGNLRVGLNLWQYLPNIERIAKIPPSMMLQSWMGSDFTNDDLVKTSSLTRDYTHAFATGNGGPEGAREKVDGQDAWKIILTPKPDAPVTWGKVVLWVTDKNAVPVKQEFWSENGELLKEMTGTEIRTFGKRTIPTVLTMRNLKKPGARTTLRYNRAKFDEKIPDSIFTQEFLRRPVRD